MANVDQRRINNQHSDFTSAREAARLLDVKPATLYAYVSRGLLRSIDAPRGRARLYSVTDLHRLRARRDARRGHTAVAASALDWGAPVLDSAITRIDARGPHYRGRSALQLARAGSSFEEVAELLWDGPASWAPDREAPRVQARLEKLVREPMSLLARLTAFVSARGLADKDRIASSSELERDRAARLIYGMTCVLGEPGAGKQARLAELVCRAFGIRTGVRERAAIDQMLVLCADHELNISAFAVRVTASGGADLYACVTAGLCALSGGLHGGQCDRVELFAETCRADSGSPHKAAERQVRARLSAGDAVPGFGQPLYPDGDPRGVWLQNRARELAPRAPRVQTLLGISSAMAGMGRRDPTLDLGLCALSAALGLPLGAASGIFALGRVAGWVAHALEQRTRPVLLRPRARYVGP
ncbi:MAG TPA: citrate synthase family protein [Polyangiales bacterium]|nr:citrate synthase family protein [Polyangiales bacterium]